MTDMFTALIQSVLLNLLFPISLLSDDGLNWVRPVSKSKILHSTVQPGQAFTVHVKFAVEPSKTVSTSIIIPTLKWITH